MHIVILGAGQVGASVAESLASENNDITVVDSDRIAWRICRIASTCGRWLAMRPIPRYCASAGLEDAEMLIAVTQSDQTNLVACKVAHSVFNVPTRIARLRPRDFLEATSCSRPTNFAVDYALCRNR